MDENRFWSMIGEAWSKIGVQAKDRRDFAFDFSSGDFSDRRLMPMISSLKVELQELEQENLLSFDRILEQKLYDIDRAELHEHTEGSDDTFLYARGFIVAMGFDYYSAIAEQPSLATTNQRCEEICYLSMHVYDKLFGKMPSSDISRESFSNPTGNWDD